MRHETGVRGWLLPLGLITSALAFYFLTVHEQLGDFDAARDAGRRVLSGLPVYAQGDPFSRLPIIALLMVPFALAGTDLAHIGWFAGSCAALVVLLRWSVVTLPERRWSERTLILLAAALLAASIAQELTTGRMTLILGVLLLTSLGARQLDAPRLAGAMVGLAAWFSPIALLLTPWIAASSGGAAAAVVVGTFSLGLALPALRYGWTGNVEQLTTWWQQLPAASAHADNVSIASLSATWISPPPLAAGLAALTALTLCAVAVTIFRQRTRVDAPDYLECAVLLVLIPLLAPDSPAGLLILAIPAVMLIVDRWRELQRPWQIASAAALLLLWALPTIAAITIVSTLAQMRLRSLG